MGVLTCTTIYEISEFSFKLPFLQILKSLHNAWACLRNVICHFYETSIISTKLQKLKTVFVKQMHSLQEYCGADSISVW